MIDTRCPNCNVDIEQQLKEQVLDGAGLYFEYECACGEILDVEVEMYIEFDIRQKPIKGV